MFTGFESHTISFIDAGDLTKEYRTNNPGALLGGFFGKKAIEDILKQRGCVGIRIYLGNSIKEEKTELVFVLVGVDEEENDLVGDDNVCMEYSIPCPNHCGSSNVLNS